MTTLREDSRARRDAVAGTTPVSSELFRAGMRRLAGAVSIVTSGTDERRVGLLATSVSSLSADPPSLLVSVNRSTSSHGPILASKAFGVSVLAERHRHIAHAFGTSAGAPERFREGEWTTLASPVLMDSLACFTCSLKQTMSYGTHTILVGLITEIGLAAKGADPLLYFDGAYRRLA